MPNLDNIRVVDLSRLLPGPYCTMLLANMGADVIKVESVLAGDPSRLAPPFKDGVSVSFTSLNRNKRSLALNVRKQEGRDVLQALLRSADVVVESFKPGRAARLGLDHESVRALNASLIYCSLSGYGQTGRNASRSGHDVNFLALAGLLDLLRAPDGRPVIPGFQLADVVGGLFATIAILGALVEQRITGRGQYVDVSIWESSASLLTVHLAPLLMGMREGLDVRGYLAGDLPGYNVFETSDGQYMTLGALEPVLWAEFCKAMDRQDLIPYQFPQEGDRAWVIEEVAAIFRRRTRGEWEDFFSDVDLCCEPVLSLEEVAQAMQGDARSAAKIGESLKCSAPQLGEHTEEILSELGYDVAQVEELQAQKVVATPADSTIRRLKGLP